MILFLESTLVLFALSIQSYSVFGGEAVAPEPLLTGLLMNCVVSCGLLHTFRMRVTSVFLVRFRHILSMRYRRTTYFDLDFCISKLTDLQA